MRLIGGLPHAVDASRRYAVHLVLVLVLLFGVALGFWTFWALRDVVWTFSGFLLALSLPGVTYFNAATLVPENPGNVISWRDHYYDVRVRFFLGIAGWAMAAATSASVNLGVPLVHPTRIGHMIFFVAGVAGVLSSNPRVHAWLTVAMATLVLLTGFTIGARPGWLAG